MNPRLLIPMLCVGAVVFACGPRARNEAATPKRDSAAPRLASATTAKKNTTTPSADADAKPSVNAHLYVHTGASSLRIAMQVVNSSKRRIELTFPSGQTYDFVILDSLGREMWQWSAGRMFTQALRNKVLKVGETMELEETWHAPTLAPGRYLARGVLTSENFPLVETTEFTVSATNFAQKN